MDADVIAVFLYLFFFLFFFVKCLYLKKNLFYFIFYGNFPFTVFFFFFFAAIRFFFFYACFYYNFFPFVLLFTCICIDLSIQTYNSLSLFPNNNNLYFLIFIIIEG